jgi:predicted acyl esterase
MGLSFFTCGSIPPLLYITICEWRVLIARPDQLMNTHHPAQPTHHLPYRPLLGSAWLDENENAINVTAGYLRASLRAVDEAVSKRGSPSLPCRNFEVVPFGEKVTYRIPLVPNARCFRAGHKLRLYLTTDDQNPDKPALLEFRHASVGTSSFNTVFSSSRLLLPFLR